MHNYSKWGSKYSSPYRQPINNRRNLSIKQSWDKPRIFNKNNLVNNQIGKEHKKVEFENKHLAKVIISLLIVFLIIYSVFYIIETR